KEVEHAMLPQTLQEALHAGIAEDDLRDEDDKPKHEDHNVLAINYNQGAHANNKDRHTPNYFQHLALGIDEFFRNHPQAPLVIAGVEELHPIYRTANNYDQLVDEGVMGNPDALGVNRLHEEAWEAVQKHFKKQREKAKEGYERAKGGGLYSTDLQAVLKAAHEGRVMDLFIAQGTHTWGKFDPVSGNVMMDGQVAAQDKMDLVNLAATQAILTSADVHILPPTEMPDGATVAASMRY
ncbi:MAG TPA: hypothetical protein VEC36_00975, partial [Patescibacteria group bacterium]|nr:hypothetical protein [Patescibacteria group bacterium]